MFSPLTVTVEQVAVNNTTTLSATNAQTATTPRVVLKVLTP